MTISIQKTMKGRPIIKYPHTPIVDTIYVEQGDEKGNNQNAEKITSIYIFFGRFFHARLV